MNAISLLTSPLLFYGSLPFSLAAPVLLLFVTARFPTTGETLNEKFHAILRPDFAEIHSMLQRLLKSGFDRSFLVVTFKKTKYFIQFRKYIHAKGDYGVELGFPLAEWSKAFVPRLRDHCAANGIDFMEGTEARGDRMEFLHVDFGRDDLAAFRMAEAIVTEVFRLPLDSHYNWKFSGLHTYDELVDSPRRRPLSQSAAWRRMNEEIAARSGIRIGDVLWNLFAGLCRYSGTIGLCHGLLWKASWAIAGRLPEWGGAAPVSLLDMTIHPRVFDLVCIGFIVAALIIVQSRPARRIRAARRKNHPDILIVPDWWRTTGRVFPRALRLPVIIAATIAFWVA